MTNEIKSFRHAGSHEREMFTAEGGTQTVVVERWESTINGTLWRYEVAHKPFETYKEYESFRAEHRAFAKEYFDKKALAEALGES